MDTFNGHPYKPGEIESQWWHLQLKTTMDIDCPEWMDWFHGGLQFQIEHHLYPRMPRHSYRKIKPYVMELCAKHNVRYYAPSFIQGNIELVKHLHSVALEARSSKYGQNFFTSILWQGLNAEG